MATKAGKSPTYLTTNRAGTYVFQVRIPKRIRQNNPSLKQSFWRSLGTKDRAEALRRSKRVWVMFDDLSREFRDADVFGKAMELLMRYDQAVAEGRHMEFLESLDDTLVGGESDLFERALAARGNGHSKISTLVEDNQRYKAMLDHQIGGPSTAGPEPSTEYNPMLRELVEQFMAHKRDTGARAASLKWYDQKVHQFASIIEALNQGDPLRVSELNADLMRSYATVMYRYPKHAQTRKLTRDMPEQDRVKLVLEHDRDALEALGFEPIGYQTIGHNFTAVRELLRFAEKQQYPIAHNLGDLIPTPKKKRGEKPQVKFDAADLKALFHSQKYREGKFKQASDYWLPLLAVFGGQTQAELCQLHVSDIQRRDGIWYMDINDQAEKVLKTEGGRPRQVPLHHQLIRLGFLEFVESCRLRGQVRLFPEEVRDKNDKYAGYSKRFNRWRKQLGIEFDSNGGRKTFHSFRHLVSDWLVGNQCHPGVAADIIGHEGKERTETRRTYSDGAWLEEKDRWIQKLDYGIDWSKIAPWSRVAGYCRS